MKFRTLFQSGVALGLACGGAAQAQTMVYYAPHSGERVEFDANNPPARFKSSGAPTVQHKSKSTAFNLTFTDVDNNNGLGFDDPGQGATRQALVLDVLDYLDAVLGENGVCDITFEVSETGGNGFLAAAGTLFFTSPNGFQPGIAFEHITTGVDVAGPTFDDIFVTVDFGYNWNATLANPGGAQFDLFSVLLHEITHGLGITSLTSGTSGNSSVSGSNPGVYTNWDDLLQTGNATKLWNSATTVFQSNASGMQGGANGIKFLGANATAAFGSNPPVYAPATFAAGSSISHFSTGDIPGGAVMEHAISPGTQKRTYAPVEIGTFIDLGYVNAAAVAETPTVALSATTYNTSEGAGTVSVTITVNQAPGTTESVTIQSAVGTAGGLDYTPISQSVNVGPTAASVIVPIAIADDPDVENAESFTVTLSGPSAGIVLGTPITATITIAASDGVSEDVTVVSQSNGGFVEEGSTRILSVVFSGITGSPEYLWKHDGGDSFGDVTGVDTATLTINNVGPTDGGTYILTGIDEAKGTFESGPIVLVVAPPDSLPVAGMVGLGVLAVSCLMGGAVAFRKRK